MNTAILCAAVSITVSGCASELPKHAKSSIALIQAAGGRPRLAVEEYSSGQYRVLVLSRPALPIGPTRQVWTYQLSHRRHEWIQLDSEMLPAHPISGGAFHHVWPALDDRDSPFIAFHDSNDFLFHSLLLKPPHAL